MSENKTKPSELSIDSFLQSVSPQRQQESQVLIEMMQTISDEPAVMWGPSIIGFGSYHYKYETGREGDMPMIGFSPRKASLTIYIYDGFHEYGDLLDQLGKHKTSVSCLYITKLTDISLPVLQEIVQRSYAHMLQRSTHQSPGWKSVDDYLDSLQGEQKQRIEQIRALVAAIIPDGEEAISYQIPTMKLQGKNVVHYAAHKDHVSIYPIPKNMDEQLKPYIRGKGTLWFGMKEQLPTELLQAIVKALLNQRS